MINNYQKRYIVIATLCIIIIGVALAKMDYKTKEKCVMSGCNNEAAKGSGYCYMHENGYRSKDYSNRNSLYQPILRETTEKNSNESTSGYKMVESTTSKKIPETTKYNSKKKQFSKDSYDAGYNSVYEDDDYDWDRYRRDKDYARGVDDAEDEEDEDGEDW